MQSIKLFNYSRNSTLIFLKKVEEKDWDIQPDAWPNTLRWHAGHIYAEAERFMYDSNHQYKITRPDWMDLFLDGTRPSEWPESVPSSEEIIQALEEQTERFKTFFADKWESAADDVRDLHGTLLDTPDAALQFCIFHEGLHLGAMKGLKLAI